MYAQSKIPAADRETDDFLQSVVDYARKMTPEERLQTLVRAGVFTPDGKLTERFRSLAGDEPTED